MAAGGPVQQLREELTCSVCLDYFRDPVMIGECGHNFCQACLTRSWRESVQVASCPECRERIQLRSLKPNRHLAKIIEIAKILSLEEGREREAQAVEGPWRSCDKHQEPLKLFCRVDRGLICVVCDRSKEHKYHDAIPMEEAAQEYKEILHGCIEIWRKEGEGILARKADTEKQTQGLLEQRASAREKSMAAFRKLRQYLEEEEQLLLTEMEVVEKEIVREGDEHLARFFRELSSLESLILEMQKKIQQPASEFLQDIESILKKCERKEVTGNSFTLNPELTRSIDNFEDKEHFLNTELQRFQDTMESHLHQVYVTLDPDTAHPKLILSEDWKSVRSGEKCQNLPNNPERFESKNIVLGCERFTSGRHFWEVFVGMDDGWAVGVARKSVKRKGEISIKPGEGIWAVGRWFGSYKAFDHLHYPSLSLSDILRKIRVSLNYTEGRVDFSNAETGAPLYTFSVASFKGETLFPFFRVFGNGSLKMAVSGSALRYLE